MPFGRGEIDRRLDGGVHHLGHGHDDDAEHDGEPIDAADAQGESGCDGDKAQDHLDLQVALGAEGVGDAGGRAAEGAREREAPLPATAALPALRTSGLILSSSANGLPLKRSAVLGDSGQVALGPGREQLALAGLP